jgi:hypothetical protein
MTIKRVIPKMLLVVGLVWTCLVSMPNCALSEPPPVTPQAITEALKDGVGNVIGTKTTILHGTTGQKTVDTTYTAGQFSGEHVIQNFDDKGKLITSTESKRDGTRADYHVDASGSTVTTTRPDGTVETMKLDPGGSITSQTKQTTYPNGTVTTQTIDPKTGKSTGLMIKDPQGKVTTAVPDGKGGFTSAVVGEHGKVATTSYDKDGKLTSQTVKDKRGEMISTTAITSDGKGGYSAVTKNKKGQIVSTITTTTDSTGGHTSVTKDKMGSVRSTTVYDSTGKVVSQSGEKPKTPVGFAGQTSGEGPHKGDKQAFQGTGTHVNKNKFQAEVFHRTQEKSDVQDSVSSGTSSVSGQQKHHRRH